MSYKQKSNKTDIAIIGMACRFPGADNYNAFWDNLEKGVNSIKEVPPGRWEINRHYSSEPDKPNKSVSKWYGLIEDVDKFDNRFFNISPGEARYMDPQQRLLLEEAWRCIEDSGVALTELRKNRTDVYVGKADWDYILNAQSADINIHTVLGNHSSLLSNRISYMLGLRGASLTIDTACSSSLFAVEKAREALLSCSTEYALVASSCVHCHPLKYIAFSKGHIVSPDGQCKTFDKDANGFVLGDGVGALLLQRLEDAIMGKKHIYGIIKGGATNHGGRGITISSPQVTAQAEVLSAAYEQAGIGPDSINYIEAHGTGTLIGDPIEVEALTTVFRQHTDKKQFCKIGSVKTNIGHTGGSAGMAGIIKVLMMMRAGKIPPNLNFNTPNPVIDFEDSPFQVPTKLCDWTSSDKKTALRAGISAFGFGGANAHVVIEAPPLITEPKRTDNDKGLFTLSAKSEQSLIALLDSWKAFARTDQFNHLSMGDICKTLATGRESFVYRFGCIVDNHDELCTFLNEAPSSFSIQEKRPLCLRIGECEWKGWEDLKPLFKDNALFEPEMEHIISALEKTKAGGKKVPGLHRKKWGANHQLYRFMAGYAFLKSFLEISGIVPDLLVGETKNSGFLTALTLSGSLSVEDALEVLSGRLNAPDIVLRRPDITFFNPVALKPVYPFHFDAEYLQNLRKNLSITDEAAAHYLSKAASMLDNQFTFKHYVAEWDAVLKTKGSNIRQIINDEKRFADEKCIFSVIIANCIRKLNRKWNISEKNIAASPEFFEIVDLITNNIMPKEIAVALFQEDDPDFEAVADTLNGNQKNIDAATDCSILKEQKLTEIGDFAQWLKKTENTVICDPEGMLCCDFGTLVVDGSVKDSVVMDMAQPSAAIVGNTMLKLWLKGVETNFRTLYPDGSFQKVALPVYPFKGESYWLSRDKEQMPGGTGGEIKLHPLLHWNTSDLSEQRFSATFTGDEFFLADHRVKGRKVLPGVAHLEMARAALAMAAGTPENQGQAIVLKNVVWVRPIVFEGGLLHVNIGLFPLENGEIGYEIYEGSGVRPGEDVLQVSLSGDTDISAARAPRAGDHKAPAQVFSQGTARFERIREASVSDIKAFKAQCSRAVIPAAKHYGWLKEAGLDLGLTFQGIETIYVGDDCAMARLVMPSGVEPTMEGFVLHPGLLDAALQTASCLFNSSGAFELSIPFSLKSIEIFRGTATPMWSLARKAKGSASPKQNRVEKSMPAFDVEIYDASGNLCVRVLDIAFRKPKFEINTGMGTLMLHPMWREEDAGGRWSALDYHRHLILVCGGDGISETALKSHLKDAEVQVLLSDRETIDERFQDYANQVFKAIQDEILHAKAISAETARRKKLIQVVLSGPEINPWLHGLSGLLKTAHLENPGLVCQLIEMDLALIMNKGGLDSIEEKLRQNGACPDDSVVRYTAGKRLVQRIEEVVEESSDFLWKDGCTCLITGGLGGLGLIFAREISQRVKDATLILTGRSKPGSARQTLIDGLKKAGAKVEYRRVDVGKKDELASLITHIGKVHGPLTGVIHSAGVISDNYILKKSIDEFEAVMAPKVKGLVNLDLTTKDQPLDFFIIFSSMAGSLGNIGQADYACANAFAGGYAVYRNRLLEMNRRRGRTVSIHWPLWKDGGMKVGTETEKMMWHNMGMVTMGTQAGIDGFYRSISTGHSHIMVIDGDVSTIRQKLVSATPLPENETAPLQAPLADADGNQLRNHIQKILLNEISQMMGIPKASINTRASLEKYGLDSISLTEFTNNLNTDYGLELAPTLFFEYSNVDSLSRYLAAEHGAAFAPRMVGKVEPEPSLASPDRELSEIPFIPQKVRHRFAMALSTQKQVADPLEPVAIIGISGRFPMAEDIEAFWENLAKGKHCISEIPEDRWDWKALYGASSGNRTDIKWGGFIDGVGEFDPSFFGISPREAELMDPQQRLMMLYAWKAMEDAGVPPGSLAGTKTGIFVGTGGNQYAQIIARADMPVESYTSTGCIPSVGPNRMSYFLDVHGPSEPVETSCSSSLVAIHRAVEAMANGSCDMAIVGGVNTIITPDFHLSFGNAGMLSKDGKCKTFSDRADGYVRGEAVGMLFLKKLGQARQAGDHIYGVIRGTAVNHGGRSSSLTAPNPKAQTDVLVQAYRRAGIDPRNIGYIEAHGTGTSLGDPIEIEALKAAFKERYAETGSSDVVDTHCGLGSVKSNIGHTELASGVAGVIKVLLQIKHKTIVRSLHCDTVNPYIRLENSPFYIAREAREWAPPLNVSGHVLPRCAGVSSFGFGGTNAHVVIEEYINETANNTMIANDTMVETSAREIMERGTGSPYLFVLSARNEVRLKNYAQVMSDFLVRTDKTDADLADIAYTTQTGREPMEERLGLIVGSIEELLVKLGSFVAGEENTEGLYHDSVRRNKDTMAVFEADDELMEAVDKWIHRNKYSNLLSFWVKGLNFDWNALYGDVRPRRISLPTYPFARDRYWAGGELGIGTTGKTDLSQSNVINSFDLWAVGPSKTEENPVERTRTGAMMFKRSWKEKTVNAAAHQPVYEKHIIAMCEPINSMWKAVRADIQDAQFIKLESRTQTMDGRFSQCALKLFETIRTTLNAKPQGRVLLQVLVSPGQDSSMDHGLFSGLSALLKTAHMENPRIIGQFIEIGETGSVHGVLKDNSRHPEDTHIRYRDGKRMVAGFEEIGGVQEKPTAPWKDGGVYLITGGAGGLGLIFAKEIAACVNNPVLILTGRSKLGAEKQVRLDALRSTGARVEFRQSDVTRKMELQKVIDGIVSDFGGLNAIIHAAGIIKDNFIINKTPQEFEMVLAPKVAGITCLDEVSSNLNLDFFAVFSSGVGAVGNKGQSDYACANAFMDDYALYRDSLVKEGKRKGKTLSINWAPWKEGGMSIDMVIKEMMAQGTGIVAMETDTGLRAFYQAFFLEHPVVMPLEGEVQLMRRHIMGTQPELSRSPSGPGALHTAPGLLYEKIQSRLKFLFAEITRVPMADIDPDEPFEGFGIDSFMITRLNGRLEELFPEVPKTLFYEYRTLRELTRYFTREYPRECMGWAGIEHGVVKENSVESCNYKKPCHRLPIPQSPLRHARRQGDGNAGIAGEGGKEPIAVIGMSGRYPLAKNLKAYWENLKAGKDCIREIPEDRWPLNEFFHSHPDEAVTQGKSYCKWGGFIDDFADFDPLFFNISPKEGMNMDPQERLFIEVCWEVFEDAGYTKERFKNVCDGRVGVFAGITKTGYELYGPDLWRRGEITHPNTSFASLANRVSFLFNFKGPSIPIDTMCSSSLTAIHEACEHLYRNECDMAVAGGVNLYLHPSTYTRLCSLRMLTCDNKNKSFGQGGDGFLPGEGVGAVLLKPLGQALEDGDPIHALIRGTGINHGGRTSGYTIPSPVAQAELIRSVMEKAGVTSREISYVEAHGTGTELGDPIEISGLTQAFGKDTHDVVSCAIGSAKSNIGHLEAASGIAGLTKIVLQMQHGKLVPSLHAETLNPNIDFHKTPFTVQQKLEDWRPPEIDGKRAPRIAGLSSFGAGGANAHVIIEEFPDRRDEIKNFDRHNAYENNVDSAIFVLSAKNEDRLKAYALRMEQSLDSRLNLADVTYTAQTGREPMDVRIAMTVNSVAQIKEKLKGYIAGLDDIEDFYQGSVRGNKDTAVLFQADEDLQKAVSTWVAKGKYARLLDLWVRGLAFDWNLLYEGKIKPRRISLPTYPFAKERYWPIDKNSLGMNVGGAIPWKSTEHIASLQKQETCLMTFEEYLADKPLSDGRLSAEAGDTVRTLVCLLAKTTHQETVLKTLKRLSPEIEVVFVTLDHLNNAPVRKRDGEDAYQREARNHYRIFNGNYHSMENVFSAIVQDYGAVYAVLYMPALEDPEVVRDFSAIVSCIKAMAVVGLTNIRFLLAAQPTQGPDRCYPDSWVGFERSLGLVMPRMQLGVVVAKDDPTASIDMAAWTQRLWGEMCAEKIESAVYEGDKRFVYRIRPTKIGHGESLVKPNHTYLITGGCGGLGGLFAHHLVEKHTVNLILTGRSPMDEKKQALIKEIKTHNPKAQVVYLQADVGDPVAMGEGLAEYKRRFGPIAGVIHAAGIEDTATILDKDITTFDETLRPKIRGVLVLDEVLKDEPLDFICYFSSSSAILGDFGWCDYAVANRFLMAHGDFKKVQNAKTLPFVIHWPLWRAGGMGFDSEDSARIYLKSSGQRLLETKEALALFDRLLSGKGGQHLVLAGEPSRINVFMGFSQDQSQVSRSTSTSIISGKGSPTEMKRFSVKECLERDLKDHISKILAIPSGQLDVDINLAEFGFDSVGLTELGAGLSDFYDIEISPAIFFEYNTIEKLVDYLAVKYRDVVSKFYGGSTGENNLLSAVPVSGLPPASILSGPFLTDKGKMPWNFQVKSGDMAAWIKRYPECIPLAGGPLNGGGDKKPCFWIHPLTGSVEPYLKIARNMDTGLPFFGIRSKGFGTERGFLDNITEMARYYIEIISGIDPEGPYQLAGFSMGGVIAYEMTRQLQKKGQKVSNLLLLEPPFPSGTATAEAVDKIAMDSETILTTGNFFLYSHLKKTSDSNDFEESCLVNPDMATLKGHALIEYLAADCREKGVMQPVELIADTIENMCLSFAHNKKALASHGVSPLPFPEEVDIYYFIQQESDSGKIDFEKSKNRKRGITGTHSGHQRYPLHDGTRKLLGDDLTHDEHHYLMWKKLLPGLNTVRVPLSNHFDFLSNRKGLDVIIDKCRSIYQNSSSKDNIALKIKKDGMTSLTASRKVQNFRISDDCNDRQQKAVAIVGMSGRFPMARDLDEFWTQLSQGCDCISEIPKDRWDWKALYGDPLKAGNKTKVKWGGFMDNVGDFDPMFFGIAPREAQWMDPQQRLLMLYVWKAMEDAGYCASSMAGSKTAMFIGTGVSGYNSRIYSSGLDLEGYYGTAILPAMGPNRMSYFLDLHGPSEPVDTTCSSSLVAICKAVEAIKSGVCESAIAGGVNLIIDPAFHISLDRLGMLSRDGRCRTFSDQADGYARGEGVGMLFLKSLEAAKQEGNHIYGIIRGCAVNHGGRANSLTAPNPRAQVAVLKEAYEKAGVDPDTVGYIETHGTGTVLGDPIEVEALKTAFKELGQRRGSSEALKPHCGLGSVKTNIGHLELAAGVAGVIKVLLQIKHKTIVKSLHCDTVNPHIKLEGSPFYIAKSSHDWIPRQDRIPRRAGISAFGAGGVNAHVVIEEYMGKTVEPPVEIIGEAGSVLPAIFVLSAKNEERLKQYALTMGAFFDSSLKNGTSPALVDVAFTSQVGRDAMEERLALIVGSVEELRDKLKKFGAGNGPLEGVFSGNVKRDKETLALFTADDGFGAILDKWVRLGNYRNLLSLWVKGLDFNWYKLYGKQRPGRISLPTYPFTEKRYWINERCEEKSTGRGADRPLSQPLLHELNSALPARNSHWVSTTDGFSPVDHGGGAFLSQLPADLMTFEEYLEPQKIITGQGRSVKTLLFFLTEADNGEYIADALKKLSPETQVLFISGGDDYAKVSRNHYQVSKINGETYQKAIADIVRHHGAVDAVIYMFDAITAAGANVDIFYILQAMAAVNISSPVRFLMAAQLPEGPECCYAQSLVGFERSLPMVMPRMQLGVIYRKIKRMFKNDGADTDTVADITHWLKILWQELHAQKIESAVYDQDKRHVYRNRETTSETIESLGELIQPRKTYLITGGCGGLGGLLARYLVKKYGVNLILTGRSPMNESIQNLLGEIKDENRNAGAIYVQADICNADAMKKAIKDAETVFGNLSGVVHAAGIESQVDIFGKDVNIFKNVLNPKIDGTMALDEAMREQNLDFICYFSSASAILGDFGACDYAIANRFMAAFADYKNVVQSKEKHIVIHWPLWKDGGMGFDFDDGTEVYLKSSGQRLLETGEGLELFHRLLSHDGTKHLVLAGKPQRIRGFLGLLENEPSPEVTLMPLRSGRRKEMRGFSVAQCLEYDLKAHIARLLGIDLDELDADTNLADFGFDSILFSKFAAGLTEFYKTEITPSIFFGNPTIERLVQYFLEEHGGVVEAFYAEVERVQVHNKSDQCKTVGSLSSSTSVLSSSSSSGPRKSMLQSAGLGDAVPESIAIIGMSGRFPEARSIDEMWEILSTGKEAVSEIPLERFDWRGYYGEEKNSTGPEIVSNRCGILPGVSEFDASFFEISPKEAAWMDPRQRLLLQESWKALEDAGYGPWHIQKNRMGVFVGMESGDYRTLSCGEKGITSDHEGVSAVRLAYFLNFSGPAMAINTACSSGLVAAHQACQSLRTGECDTAIVAGVNLTLSPETFISLGKSGMMSPSGRCFAFDKRADGMVPGEAVVSLVFKRLTDAERDNDQIYAVINGSGINYDGRTNGITAPNQSAQAELLKAVYDRYRIDPEKITHIVTHGTGTKLGDSIEINALVDAFKGYTKKPRFCALTSTKTNFGHCFAASGLVSLVGLVQALRYETIPESINFSQENDHIKWSESPFYVNGTARPWNVVKGEQRLGAVSAFGMSGTNVHMVVQSHTKNTMATDMEIKPCYLLVFSAKQEAVLEDKIKDMAAFFNKNHMETADLAHISLTLSMGRHHFAHRRAIVVQDSDDAVHVLNQLIRHEKSPKIFKGEVLRGFKGQQAIRASAEEMLNQAADKKCGNQAYREILYGLAELYCQGYDIQLNRLLNPGKPSDFRLPTYPFRRQRHWISDLDVLKVEDQRKGTKKDGVTIDNKDAVKDPIASSTGHDDAQDAMVSTAGHDHAAAAISSGKTAWIKLMPLYSDSLPLDVQKAQPRKPITLSDTTAALPVLQTLDGIPGKAASGIMLDTLSDAQADTRLSEEYPVHSHDIALDQPVSKLLKASLAEALYMDQSDIDPDMPFTEMGMDSIIGVEWIKSINDEFGISLEAIKIYDYPNLREFAGFLASKLSVKGDDGTNDADTFVKPVPALPPNTPKPLSALPSAPLSGLRISDEDVSDTPPGIVLDMPGAGPGIESADPAHLPRSENITLPGSLLKKLKASLAEALYMDENDIDPDMPFTEMGMDSIIGVEWIKSINDEFGISLEAIKIYDYPNIQEFAGFLAGQLGADDANDSSACVNPESPAPPASLEELLQQVQQGVLDINQADQLLEKFKNL